jgi:uncharacterized protein YigE (DUF2233 family)
MKLAVTVAVASLLLATATARAQNIPTKPFPPSFMKNLAQQMVSQGQKMRAGSVNGGVSNSGNMPPGLNVVHATSCVALQADPVNVVGFIFSQEGLFVCALNPSPIAAAVAGAACANGNYVGINIYDDQGDANEIVSFPTK